MKPCKQTLAALLAALLLMTTGCVGGTDTAWVYRGGDISVPAGVYINYMITAYAEAANTVLQEMYEADPNLDASKVKSSQILKGQVDGTNVPDYILDKARSNTLQFIGVEKRFAELGLQMDEIAAGSVNSEVSDTWSAYSETYESNGISENSLRLYSLNNVKKEQLFLALYGEGGELAPSRQEVEGFFAENYARADMMVFTKANIYSEPDEAAVAEKNAGIKSTAEGYLQRLKGGEEIEELMYDYKLSMQETEEGKAGVKKVEKGSLTAIFGEEMRYYYGDTLVDGVLAAPVGQPQIIEDDYAYYMVNRLDILADSTDLDKMYNTLLKEMKTDEYEAMLAEAGSAGLTVNDKALSRYQPKRLKLDS